MKKIKRAILFAVLLTGAGTTLYANCLECSTVENKGKCSSQWCASTNEVGEACCGNPI
ncbi:hypothetical protein [Daejeonella lutea]|uniref:Uncharacterized protein n=1 Tax=Daejeonella lutea TaxID=572036 RepID=A0A1T5B1N7_9SPHI|nr:hypothetical protein [Daejeonella lutea]SKB41168.1 hypothetical protein SAMN05661099_1208 [Daejeonella lutea]